MRDTHEKFTSTTIVFHWLIAIAMIGMLAFGHYLHDLPRSPEKGELLGIHKSIGFIILLVASLRVLWRMKNGFPIPLSSMPKWQELMVTLTHWSLIIGTVMMPLSGILMTIGSGRGIQVFGYELLAASAEKNELFSEIGHTVHGIGGKLLVIFVVLHVIGAIKHQYIEKDGTISRMAGKRINSNTNNV